MYYPRLVSLLASMGTRDVRIGMVTHVVLNAVDLTVPVLFIIR